MPRIGIALGSNLGDRSANLQAAREALREVAIPGEPYLEGSDYQTEPLHCPPGSPMFQNSVVEIAFDGTPSELLALTQRIEIQLGRAKAPERNAPRIIDIDLLYFGDEIVKTEDLELPHPRIGERLFVLEPLAEIRPDLVLPGMNQSIAKLLNDMIADKSPPANASPIQSIR